MYTTLRELMDLIRDEWVLFCLLTVLLFLLGLIGISSYEQRQAFMEECVQDYKQYECTVMWRNSTPDTMIITGRSY